MSVQLFDGQQKISKSLKQTGLQDIKTNVSPILFILGYSHSFTFRAATFSHVVKYDRMWLQSSTT